MGSRSLFFCSSFPLRKGQKLPFIGSFSVSHSPFSVSHIRSISGYQYYVLFIDNFSRYVWLYPMQLKYDVFIIFKTFKSLVENTFSTTIKSLQTDGGGEYVNHQLKDYLNTHGINHRLTCPHHPEQNGIAERKHRQIVDMRLTLLAHASMPTTYWTEAFYTVI